MCSINSAFIRSVLHLCATLRKNSPWIFGSAKLRVSYNSLRFVQSGAPSLLGLPASGFLLFAQSTATRRGGSPTKLSLIPPRRSLRAAHAVPMDTTIAFRMMPVEQGLRRKEATALTVNTFSSW